MPNRPRRIDGTIIKPLPTDNDRISPKDYFMELSRYKENIWSQAGEDGILNHLIKIDFGFTNKWCCEFGAWDGKKYSNTWNLIKNHGWHGIMIEADEVKYSELLVNKNETGNRLITVNCIVGYDRGDFKMGTRLDDILDSCNAPVDIDLISMDTDGPDYHIWNDLKKYRPKVVIIEHSGLNAYIIQNENSKPKKDLDGTTSFWAMKALGESKDYELLVDTGNMIWADKKILKGKSSRKY